MTSLYRKWRSQSFDELFGQEHVVRTLRNAIEHDRVAHAYLFTGPRGTGKTSVARILAKAVNCANPSHGNPCRVCESCRAVQEGRAIDVIEIDAASNTSVDSVRDLRDRVGYASGQGGFKVYIIDEVHRLSVQAFDAFLKILEEPPPHVIFVFASTEPQKVPATVASRCQRLDFRRIGVSETLARLREVAKAEGLAATDEALAVIAYHANGSLRDAVSLLDQVSAYTNDEIAPEDVRQSLGLADPRLVVRMTDCLLTGKTGSGLDQVALFGEAGGDPRMLLAQLIGYWRALLLRKTGAGVGNDADPGLEDDLRRHVTGLDEPRILAVLRALSEQEFSGRYDVAASLPLEMGYLQASFVLGQVPFARQEQQGPVLDIASAPPTLPNRTKVETVRHDQPAKLVSPPAEIPLSPAVRDEDAASTSESEDSKAAAPEGAWGGDIDEAWSSIVSRMRARSATLQAVLRSGYLMKVSEEEVTIGFLFDFHRGQFAEAKKKRMLEEVIDEVLGGKHRATCVHTTKEEIDAVRGAGTVPTDDGFVEEVAARLQTLHDRQMGN